MFYLPPRISSVTTNYQNVNFLPRVSFWIFIFINTMLIIGQVTSVTCTVSLLQTVVLFVSDAMTWNSIVGATLLILTIGFISICIRFLQLLKNARGRKSQVLRKVSAVHCLFIV